MKKIFLLSCVLLIFSTRPMTHEHKMYLEFIKSMVSNGAIPIQQNPNLPKWPEGIQYKCRTIKKLESGPYKGQEARIVRSLWSMWGIDTINTSDLRNMLSMPSENIPCWLKFFFSVDPGKDLEAISRLYYGHIGPIGRDSGGQVIAECWLSQKDQKNLLNFHQFELDTLAPQFFDPRASSRIILLSKIANESTGTSSIFLQALFLKAIKFRDTDILKRPLLNLDYMQPVLAQAYDAFMRHRPKSDYMKDLRQKIGLQYICTDKHFVSKSFLGLLPKGLLEDLFKFCENSKD